ncbi:MAG: TIGR02680 family protein [Actinomycetota bacterium]|nr:TIGR02680 family protein [Actinomycetota bacterium]
MSPSSQRWRPRRAGIVNLYEYSDQVFDFASGRLLLRGHNTSGKTKALELLLPFCLDGDISPIKLDPFASAYKDMKWNLIGCCEAEKRTGYVWLEFERLDRDGAAERLTAGIGLRANKDLQSVARWHFVARNRMIGHDLLLLHGSDPIGKADLAAALGDDGEVLDSQRDYRARLNDLLFGFGGEEQYQTMLRLMRDLRRPHLSKTLDPARVADQLTVGLPTVDEGLMRRLAGGLEQLETLERGLDRLRDVCDRVRRFHQRTYSAYARAAVRERAEALRQAQTAVEHAAERLRTTRAELDAKHAEVEHASAERDAAEADVIRLDAEQQALISSAAWSSVAEVEALREHAGAQGRAAAAEREHADTAAARAGALEAELITARAAWHERREQALADLNGVVELAGHAGLAQRVELLASQLRDGALSAETWSPLLRELAGDWRDVLHRHRELLRLARAATATAERARSDEREAAGRLERAAAKRSVCEEQLEQAQDALAGAFQGWRDGLIELRLDDDGAEAALELLLAGQAAAPALETRVGNARTGLADERSSLAADRREAVASVDALAQEIETLVCARDDGPRAPGWSRAERSTRHGAPLWRLVDFRDGLGQAERAGLEAALEASGLLDAWVDPSGALADPALADVVLVGGSPAADESLLDALQPVAEQPVAPAVVKRLLGSVGLRERDSGPWLDLDGRFALGPLSGRGAKPTAEHVGAAAREARRAARIADLQARIAQIREEIATHEAGIAEVDRRRKLLDSELASLPAVDAVASAAGALRISTALEADAARGHEQAAVIAHEAAEEEIAADAAAREHAAAHGLPAALDEPALERLRDAATELAGAAATVARAWTLAEREALSARSTGERLSEAQELAAEQDLRARDVQAEADRLVAAHSAREQALGATGEEVRRRHEQVVTAQRQSKDAHRHARDAAERARIAVAGLQRDAQARETEHETERGQREQASLGFRQLALAGILQSVLEQAAPQDSGEASSWTLTRTLEVARALPQELLIMRSSSGERGVEVQRGVQLLDRELAEADMGAYATRGEDGLLIVQVTEGGAGQTLARMLETLGLEIADREQILTAEERRVFSDALVEEIADHLRHRIHEVRGRVERMNVVLRRSPTAAGKTVELDWHPLENDQGTQRAGLALLRRDVRHLGDEARGELIAFFRARIESARREHAGSGQPRAMADTLMDAFDYRRWFAFGLHERTAAGRTRLSKQRHAVGSGGEQSVLIHLPLFAAAAALYGDSPAPRLIMLDEALSGIDDETRERVLKATVDFDLDVMMTSHELWGTYASVPQLSIYQLHRENGAFGVHAIPFLWDGDVLHEMEQGELLV